MGPKTASSMIAPKPTLKPPAQEWEIAETWTKFLFPFVFVDRSKPETFACGNEFAEALLRGAARHHIWTETAFRPRELENMLPYVKQYLTWPSNHRRFEMTQDCLSGEAIFQFATPDATAALAFRISEVVLHVFFNGVALLALEVRPVGEAQLTIEEVESINAHLASRANATPFHLLRAPHDLSEASFSVPKLCAARGELTVPDLIDTLLGTFYGRDSEILMTPMVDRFLPVYGAVLLRPVENTPIETLDERFFEFAQHHLTILRKTFTPNNISTFSQIHLEDSGHHYMPYHNVIHTQSLDGGFILAYDNGLQHFSGENAPAMESFRTSYFYMMLIPFHQRLSILRYTTAAADAGLSPERGADLRKLREEIYDFTSRCYFSQASVSEERNRIYERWQKEFHVVRMYNDLKEEVHDIDNYLADLTRRRENELRDQAMRRDSRNMQLFALITLVFLPVSVLLYAIPALPILGRWINFSLYPVRSTAIILGMAAFIVFMLIIMFRFVRRRRHAWLQDH